ncbi:MAG: S9 family peptidase [Acidobacteriota bacterium]
MNLNRSARCERFGFRHRFLVVALFLTTLPLLAEGMTPQQVAQLEQVLQAEIAPDGSTVAYTVSVPRVPGRDEDGPAWTHLWLVDAEGRNPRPFVTGKTNLSAVEWAPDGGGLYFLAKREGDQHRSLYFIPADGGEARRVLQLGTDISSYALAPDGKAVALLASEPEEKSEKDLQEKGFKAQVYEEDWKYTRLWLAELPAGQPRRLELEGSVRRVAWAPAGDRLAVSVTPTPSVDDGYMFQRIQIIDREGKLLAQVENEGKLGKFAWSPDGGRLGLLSGADLHDPSAGRLMVCPATGGKPQELFPGEPADTVDFAWKDAGTIYFIEARGVWNRLRSVRLDDRTVEDLTPSQGPILRSLSLAKNGKVAAFAADAPSHPREVYLLPAGSREPRRLTHLNPWLSGVELARQEVVTFTARDGLELEGLLLHPLGETPGTRYPLVLVVHGGPESHYSNGWLTGYSTPGQVLAARGFAVFYPNYRGSTGRGVEFAKTSQGDPAGKEFDDLVDAVDALIARGLVDGTRVGVTGGSYGGYATAWCSTYYSDRFAAGVMFVGISNKISKVGTTDIPEEEYLVHARKRPWDDWDFFLRRSPVYYADRGRTPLLILHGTDDPRVNVGQSRELYRHLKLRGKAPVRLVLYPGEVHGNRRAAARYDYLLRALRWLEHYLKGPGGDPPPYRLDYQLEAFDNMRDEGKS